MQAIVAAGGQVAGYRQAPEQAELLRAAAVREDWRQAHDWLVGGGETTPWEQLRRTINGAVDWLLDTWNRMASERSGRLDRSSDYRRLAELLVEDPESGPELFHLAFGMSPARHILVPDPDEDQLADPAAQSWWTVAGLVMDRTLRQPSTRSTTQGRTPRIPDTAQARRLAQLEADEEAKTTAQLRTRLLALDGKRLSELDSVDDDTLAAIDEWIMESGTRATGLRTAGRGGSSTPAASWRSRSPPIPAARGCAPPSGVGPRGPAARGGTRVIDDTTEARQRAVRLLLRDGWLDAPGRAGADGRGLARTRDPRHVDLRRARLPPGRRARDGAAAQAAAERRPARARAARPPETKSGPTRDWWPAFSYATTCSCSACWPSSNATRTARRR